MPNARIRRLVLATAATLLATHAAVAQLKPEQLALICNANSETSRQLAVNYAHARNVPRDRIIALDLPLDEDMDRVAFERDLRGPLRAALESRGLADTVRCLVTFYDVPLRVGPVVTSPAARDIAMRLDLEYAAMLRRVLDQCEALERIGQPAGTPNGRRGGPGMRSDLKDVLEHYERVKTEAAARVSAASESDAADLHRDLMAVLRETQGPLSLMQNVRIPPESADPRARMRAIQMRQNAALMSQQIAESLDHAPESEAREQAREMVRQALGTVGALSRLDNDRRQLRGEDTLAAVDSELALLWYETYPEFVWVYNPDNPRTLPGILRGPVEAPQPGSRPPMMVARLDGPNPRVVQRMFDDAIAAEKSGLAGNVFIDASAAKAVPGYKECNDNLIELARLVDDRTSLRVTLDTRTELFGRGDCPNTALYCGWYSHKQYVPAFEFVRGAVAFHVASSEAVSLRDPRAAYWCKGLLEDGAAVTVGPVHEPYLAAFPMPTDFFGLLLTGEYTVAECYHLSEPLLSWMMILIGDPLYRPFAANPQLRVDDIYAPDLVERLAPPLGRARPVATAPAAEDDVSPDAGGRRDAASPVDDDR